jgi:hypothetical protein
MTKAKNIHEQGNASAPKKAKKAAPKKTKNAPAKKAPAKKAPAKKAAPKKEKDDFKPPRDIHPVPKVPMHDDATVRRSDTTGEPIAVPKKRKAPAGKAGSYIGEIREGGDGNMWKSEPNKKGIYRWVKQS